MNTILIPGTHRFLSSGAILILADHPNEKWILKYGWYLLNSETKCGWYLASIPDLIIMEITDSILNNCSIVSEGEGWGTGPVSCNTTPAECPFANPDAVRHDIERYLKNTNYTEGQLLYVHIGELYQVSEDFTSSNQEGTAEENMLLDIQSGYLVHIS